MRRNSQKLSILPGDVGVNCAGDKSLKRLCGGFLLFSGSGDCFVWGKRRSLKCNEFSIENVWLKGIG